MTISAQSISLQWSDGTVAFSDLSFTLQPGFHGLVGRNGCGKSSLVKVLAGNAISPEPTLEPMSGRVHLTGTLGYVGQKEGELTGSVAQYLGVERLLDALQRIAEGSVDVADFETVGERWTFAESLEQQLQALNLWRPAQGVAMPVAELSGGQKMRLRLFKAFSECPDNLILDEPGNHLDAEGRSWLLAQCKAFCMKPQRCLLVVSHDRQLLQHVDSITELDELGLHLYEGNYQLYAAQAAEQKAAIERQLEDAIKHKKQIQQQVQRSREKAEKRQSKGKADRAGGGQAKVLLDAAKERSQQTSRALSTQMQRQQTQAQQQLTQARERATDFHEVYIHFAGPGKAKKKRLLHAGELVLPFGSNQPINLTLAPGDKLRLRGVNGSGKSTLLKLFNGQLQPARGELILNTRVHLLDQRFSLVNPKQSVLENLLTYTGQLPLTEARTALAQIGLASEAVERPAAQLSGGETMKLAMLMVTLQPESELLLFDEPDNHLDIHSKQQLAQAIRAYPGALVIVSHDDSFIEDAGMTDTLTLTNSD